MTRHGEVVSREESVSLLTDDLSRFALRPLIPADIHAVKTLCSASFPIEYPLCWFEEVVCGSLISWGLFDGNLLVAMLVAETKKISACNPEDRNILLEPNGYVVYILSLAVSREFRRAGLATRLLKHLMETVVESPPFPRAIYLHVLSSNVPAITFYKRNGFVHHETLINYYRLNNVYADGCTYVLYTNGSRPPLTFASVCRYLSDMICLPEIDVFAIENIRVITLSQSAVASIILHNKKKECWK